MWGFCNISTVKKRPIFVQENRFGIKPFYYLLTKESFSFCSEISPLLSLLNKKPVPHSQTIFDYLVFNRTDQTENTFFNEIKKLQHGCKLIIKNSQLKIDKWYDLKERVSKTEGFMNPEEYKEMFTSALGLHLRSDVPVGVCLSGGIDSSSMVSTLITHLKTTTLNTFSAVYTKGQVGDESEFIDEYKSLLSNMHYTTPSAETLAKDLKHFVKALGEPIPSTSPYAQYKVIGVSSGKGSLLPSMDRVQMKN